MNPEIKSIKRHRGVAGNYAYAVVVQYEGEGPSTLTLSSSEFGGPIVMTTEGNPRGVYIGPRVLDRLGCKLDEAWVRAFFAPREEGRDR